ncbi:LOW QUALITY PROTEIN: leucine-rich repeat-containing protein 49 [Microcaecilia unicolor]|uniref:LOW QUALITY PROTEIN: leucine-rich repeat-containing protein 49 n=1 Tax=Microcaecilia unicolor TaxID=1415580 RepID=A0A6P7WMI9_9AMPH|nr:LOW QUALITY PROTEIN: leucine-rich repeat-containing protein 49 [Microcaecilia unicolor]
MQPNKYRGRLTSNTVNSCGSQVVFHPSVPDRNKQFEFRLNKEQPTLYNRILLHDLEKNSSGRQGDARLSSPLARARQTPGAASVVDIFAAELKHGIESLPVAASGEINLFTPAKSRSRPASHRSVLNVSKCQADTYHGKGDHINYIRGKRGGFPVVQRPAEEKAANPDLLNLERQNLAACPVIEGEEQLRLLNLQHNFITQIQNLMNLRRLVFLDLFNNQIEVISGISTLRSLRVLMLGGNRIKKISNLENLESLDILDLHGNQITKIENISHLSELRVLNLARNSINQVENLSGLDSLVELNLRNNQINYVRDVDTLPNLQRLYLSFNSISCFEDILCLADSTSIADVTLDGNPIAQEPWYKQTILGHMLQLRQLDMKRITEEERRTASLLARREEEKKRESHKQALLKEKKRLAIYNLALQWEKQQNRVVHVLGSKQDQKDYDDTSHKPCPINGSATYAFPEENRSLDTVLNSALQGLSVIDSHFVELEGDTLYLYGSGALESLERSWSLQSSGTVTTLFFTFIDFDEIVQVLPKVKMKFPNASHLKFKETNLTMFQQFNALAQVRRLDQLTVDPQGNPVVNFTLWKYYVLFRLSHFNLQKINGTEISSNDLVMAEKLFGILAYVASSDLPQFRLFSLLGESRKKHFNQFLEGKAKKSGVTTEESNDSRRVGGEHANRVILNYTTKDLQTERLEEIKEKNKFCHAYVLDLVKEASDISLKNETLQKLWPQMFIELVRDAVIEVRNKNSYMKLGLQKIIDQK